MTSLNFRFGGYQKPKSIHTLAGAIFGGALNARLGDGISFRLDNDITERGFKTGDLIGRTKSGDLTFCYMSTSYFSNDLPEMTVLDLPFIFEDRHVAYDLLDGGLGELLRRVIEAANPDLRLLSFWDNGFRHFSNRVRPIRTPADCQGIRTRTLPSLLHGKIFKLLGFDPVAVNIKTFIDEIETGDIDGQDNPLTNIYHFNVHKHHRYITLTGHILGFAGLYCNAAAYASWTPDIQQAVNEAAREATAAQRNMAAAEDIDILAKLDPAENEVISLSQVERAAFIQAVAPIIDEQRDIIGDELMDFVCPPT